MCGLWWNVLTSPYTVTQNKALSKRFNLFINYIQPQSLVKD